MKNNTIFFMFLMLVFCSALCFGATVQPMRSDYRFYGSTEVRMLYVGEHNTLYKMPSSGGSTNEVLAFDGNGNVVFINPNTIVEKTLNEIMATGQSTGYKAYLTGGIKTTTGEFTTGIISPVFSVSANSTRVSNDLVSSGTISTGNSITAGIFYGSGAGLTGLITTSEVTVAGETSGKAKGDKLLFKNANVTRIGNTVEVEVTGATASDTLNDVASRGESTGIKLYLTGGISTTTINSGAIISTGAITADTIHADGQYLTNVLHSESDTLSSVTARGNSTSSKLYITGGISSGSITSTGTISTSSSITGGLIYGDGRNLTNLPVQTHNSLNGLNGDADYYHLSISDRNKVKYNSFPSMKVTGGVNVSGEVAITGKTTIQGAIFINDDMNVNGTIVANNVIADLTGSTGTITATVFSLFKDGVVAEAGGIAKGKAVYISEGATGTNSYVKLADNNKTPDFKFAGIANETKAFGETISIVVEGKISGLNTSVYTQGQTVFLYSAGAWGTTEVTTGASIAIGKINYSHPSAGSIDIFEIPRSNLTTAKGSDTYLRIGEADGGSGGYLTIRDYSNNKILTIDNTGNITSKSTVLTTESITAGLYYGNAENALKTHNSTSNINGDSPYYHSDLANHNKVKYNSFPSMDITAGLTVSDITVSNDITANEVRGSGQYLTGVLHSESDTLNSVVARGESTATKLYLTGGISVSNISASGTISTGSSITAGMFYGNGENVTKTHNSLSSIDGNGNYHLSLAERNKVESNSFPSIKITGGVRVSGEVEVTGSVRASSFVGSITEHDTLNTVAVRGNSTAMPIYITAPVKIQSVSGSGTVNYLSSITTGGKFYGDGAPLTNVLHSESDTLQTVTDRGATTTKSITVDAIHGDGQYLTGVVHSEADTLATVSARGQSTSLQLFVTGGVKTSNVIATGTVNATQSITTGAKYYGDGSALTNVVHSEADTLNSVMARGQSTTYKAYITGGAKLENLSVTTSATVTNSVTADNLSSNRINAPHNTLTNMQGGQSGQYWHLNTADRNKVNANSFSSIGVTSGVLFRPSTAPTRQEGLTYYDSTKKALSYYNEEADTTMNIGQESWTRVYNATASTITNGKVVYVDSVNSGIPTIKLADAQEYSKTRVIGMATHDIEASTYGYVTKFGVVGSVNTASFSSGDVIYLDCNTPGAITTTNATGGCFEVYVGKILTAAADGSILVDPYLAEKTRETNQTNGFPPSQRTATSMAFNDSSLKFSIYPNTGTTFYYYVDGVKYIKTATQEVTISDVTGLHVIYYNGATLTSVANPSSGDVDTVIRTKAVVAYVYWNTGTNLHYAVLDERHGIVMSPDTHSYLHFINGTQFLTGLALNSLIVDNTGALNSHAQFGNDLGYTTDEDLMHSILTNDSTIGLPIWYRAGASGDWIKTTNAGFSILTAGTGRLAYNQWTGTIWQLTECTDNSFALIHIYATNNTDRKLISIVGQSNYSSAALARAGANTEINNLALGSLPSPEILPVASVIFQTRDAYSNSVNARIVSTDTGASYVDWRTAKLEGGSAPSSHSLLSNLSSDDHLQYLLVSGLRSATAFNDSGEMNITGATSIGGNTNIRSNLNVNGKQTVSGTISTPSSITAGIFYGSGAHLTGIITTSEITLQGSNGVARKGDKVKFTNGVVIRTGNTMEVTITSTPESDTLDTVMSRGQSTNYKAYLTGGISTSSVVASSAITADTIHADGQYLTNVLHSYTETSTLNNVVSRGESTATKVYLTGGIETTNIEMTGTVSTPSSITAGIFYGNGSHLTGIISTSEILVTGSNGKSNKGSILTFTNGTASRIGNTIEVAITIPANTDTLNTVLSRGNSSTIPVYITSASKISSISGSGTVNYSSSITSGTNVYASKFVGDGSLLTNLPAQAHNSTTGKQGGTTNEYYHLSVADFNKVNANSYPSMSVTAGISASGTITATQSITSGAILYASNGIKTTGKLDSTKGAYFTESITTGAKIYGDGASLTNVLHSYTETSTFDGVLSRGNSSAIPIYVTASSKIQNISGTGNVNYTGSITTGSKFYGDGSALTNLPAQNITFAGSNGVAKTGTKAKFTNGTVAQSGGAGTTVEITMTQAQDISINAATANYITVNHTKYIEQASTDLVEFPASSSEVVVFFSKETKKLSYINYSKDIYNLNATFWKNINPQEVIIIDATQNSSTDFLETSFWSTVAGSTFAKTVNTCHREESSATRGGYYTAALSVKKNLTMTFVIDVQDVGYRTLCGISAEGDALTSSSFIWLNVATDETGTFQTDYNGGSEYSSYSIGALGTGKRYIRISLLNYNGGSNTVDVSFWYKTTNPSGIWGTATTTTTGLNSNWNWKFVISDSGGPACEISDLKVIEN